MQIKPYIYILHTVKFLIKLESLERKFSLETQESKRCWQKMKDRETVRESQ